MQFQLELAWALKEMGYEFFLEVLEDGDPADVLENPQNESLKRFLGKYNH